MVLHAAIGSWASHVLTSFLLLLLILLGMKGTVEEVISGPRTVCFIQNLVMGRECVPCTDSIHVKNK